jgi:hypothetical protein
MPTIEAIAWNITIKRNLSIATGSAIESDPVLIKSLSTSRRIPVLSRERYDRNRLSTTPVSGFLLITIWGLRMHAFFNHVSPPGFCHHSCRLHDRQHHIGYRIF